MLRSTLAVAIALFALCGTGAAQKSKDTLRIALDQPIRLIDALHNPNPEANLVDRAVMDTLVAYDLASHSLQGPAFLAESWQRVVDDTTLDVTLRRGVKFHDGVELDADDVIYSLAYASDPNVNFLFKDARFGWFDKAEKIDAYTVRIHAKEPTGIILARLWGGPPILPAHIRQGANSPTRPSSAASRSAPDPYKVVSFDPSAGIVLERNPDYNWGGFEAGGADRADRDLADPRCADPASPKCW